MQENSKYINQAGVGRLAIALARESVFGADVMKTNRLSDEGIRFIRDTLRNLFQEIDETSFSVQYWQPAKQAIRRACGRMKISAPKFH